MASDADLKSFARLQGGVQFDSSLKLVSQLPSFPKDMRDRFPSLAQYEASLKEWHASLLLALQGGAPVTITSKKLTP